MYTPPSSTLQRWLLSGLAAAGMVYCLMVLAFVATSPDTRLRCLISDETAPGGGLIIKHVARNASGDPFAPAEGDVLVELAGRPLRTFVDLARTEAALRTAPIGPNGHIVDRPSRVPADSRETLVQWEARRYVKAVVAAPGAAPAPTWVLLQRQPLGGLVLSLIWLVLQTVIFALAGLGHWQRPFDRPLRVFFAMCGVTLVAYIGGNHWWVVAGSLAFVIPFAVCAVLLPALLLHFLLVYPFPKPLVARWPRAAFVGVYAIPVATALGAVVLFITGAWLTRTADDGGAALMRVLRSGIYGYVAVAGAYFVFSLVALVDSVQRARNPIEHQQVKWILWAALLATVPVGYTLALAYFDRATFAFGGARLPMFLASLAFMLAYAVGIVRYKLMLIDQVVNRGLLYYALSFGLTLAFGLLIAVTGVAAWNEGTSTYGYAVPVVFVLMLAVIGLAWFRDRVQNEIDRWFFREKYPLDRALQRMNRAVSSLLERGDVADNMLVSCCEVLRVDQAALYLREEGGPRFRLATAVGKCELPLSFEADAELLEQLEQDASFQRVPSGTSPVQVLLRRIGAELVHGLEVDGDVAGLVALGAKPNSAAYTAEDVTFLTAVSRITSVALHCGKVHEDISRLNRELRTKTEKIAEQGRQISLLQRELSSFSDSGAAPGPAGEFRRDAIRGNSPAIRHVLETVRKVSSSDASVMVRGESGTGKELLARAIHENSPRRNGPLVSVHCAALAPSLLESELFGHVRGAFTDARDNKTGRFAMADGGTLFLDEIGDISLDVQVKLLRVLQERTFEPVGSSKPIAVDVRLIAATHRNLEQLITEGRFREDLYYRINVISIALPPLRDREDDVFELAVHFLRRAAERTGKRVSQFDEAAIDALMKFSWPGNIRQLENVIERAVVLAEADRITVADLPAELRDGHHASGPAVGPSRRGTYRPEVLTPRTAALRTPAPDSAVLVNGSDDERLVLLAALDQCQGNKAEAARVLGLPRSTYFSKLRKHGIG